MPVCVRRLVPRMSRTVCVYYLLPKNGLCVYPLYHGSMCPCVSKCVGHGFFRDSGALRTGPPLILASATKADKPQARRGRVHATRERAHHVTGRGAAGLVPARGSSLNAGPHLDRGSARRTARQRQCRARSALSLTTAAGRR